MANYGSAMAEERETCEEAGWMDESEDQKRRLPGGMELFESHPLRKHIGGREEGSVNCKW